MADLIQIGKGTSVTVTETFELDGTPANADAVLPTLVVRNPDGTAYTPLPTVLDTWAGPPARTTGQYRFVLPRQFQVTWLDYELTATIGGQPQTLGGRVEWIGQPLFNLARFRALKVAGQTPFATTATPLYSDRQIMDARTAVLEEFTDILGFSPVQRFAREIVDSSYGDVLLARSPAGPLLTVKVSGTAQLITSYSLHPAGMLRPVSGYLNGTPIPYGLSNVVVEYVHGTERPPGKGGDMAMMYAAAMLNPSGFSSAVSVSTPDGASYSYEPSEIGRNNFVRHTGIRDIDRWLNIHRVAVAV